MTTTTIFIDLAVTARKAAFAAQDRLEKAILAGETITGAMFDECCKLTFERNASRFLANQEEKANRSNAKRRPAIRNLADAETAELHNSALRETIGNIQTANARKAFKDECANWEANATPEEKAQAAVWSENAFAGAARFHND